MTDLRGLFLRNLHGRASRRARERMLKDLFSTETFEALIAKVVAHIRGKDSIPVGTTPTGEEISISLGILMASAMVVGASGSGKTRFLLGILQKLFVLAFSRSSGSRPGPRLEIELVDPKTETFVLAKQILAAMYLEADEGIRAAMRRSIRVIDWSREAVSPFAPYDNAAGLVSSPYMAHLRTDVMSQASAQTYTESLKQALYMLSWLLVEKRFPPNLRFLTRLYSDAAFRARVVDDIAEPDLRDYFLGLDRTLARQTSEALIRRWQHDLSFPEVRLSVCIPPSDLDSLLPKGPVAITLGNYGAAMALPPGIGKERATHRIVDRILAAPRRNPSVPGWLVLEEAPRLLTGSSELTEPIADAARTLRSVGLGILFSGQDVQNALPAPLVRTLLLNTRWWAIFRSNEEASWVYPHALLDDALAGLGEAERQREFRRRMEALHQRSGYLLAKGERAIPFTALDVPDPRHDRLTGDALVEVFDKEIGLGSMVSAKVAADRIARWEADVVGRADVPPTPKKVAPAFPGGIPDLLAHLGKKGKV